MDNEHTEDGEHWLSISDMMSGLMVIFLFIAITYMMQVKEEKQKIQQESDKIVNIAESYEKNKGIIYKRLWYEFHEDEKKWNAKIDEKNLSISFYNPEILFDVGKAEIKPQFQEILNDFFPRYINIVLKDYKEEIEEIRIEGHTSSEWDRLASEDESYFKNMALSQERTRATLKYCLSLPSINENKKRKKWLKSILTANGLSSSKLIQEDGVENKEKSRRVEFRIRTNAEEQMLKIIQDKPRPN